MGSPITEYHGIIGCISLEFEQLIHRFASVKLVLSCEMNHPTHFQNQLTAEGKL